MKEAGKALKKFTGLGDLLGGDEPELPEVKKAPIIDDEEAKKRRMRDYTRKYGKAGRAGTVLQRGSKLG